MPKITWLALGYNMPANPSRNRVFVWRKLKDCGAGYFKQSVAILPKSPQSMAQFQDLAATIRNMGGEATLAELRFVESDDEARTIQWFQHQSEEEYTELLRDCADAARRVKGGLLRHMESGDNLKKLQKRLVKARSRDYFNHPRSGHSRDSLRAIDELLSDMASATTDLKKQFQKLLDDN